MKTRKLGAMESRVALMVVLLGAGFLFLFSKLPERIAAMEAKRKYEGEFYQFAQLFSEIYADIQDRYVHDVDSKKVFEGAIRGMFAALEDPHSQWLSPDSLEQLEKETEGEFSGVGLNITLQQGVLTVIAPIPGTPAAKAGMMPMDRIIKIEGATTEGITLLEAVKKLTGPTGTSVNIEVFREGEADLLKMTLTRETIKIESVFSQVLEGDIGYIRIARFAETTAEDTRKAIEAMTASNVKGLVVDLRYDSGGLLDKSVEICNFFLPKGQIIVSTKGRKEENNREFFAQSDSLTDLPMVVLVNAGSASASEIFAGAMQDTKRAVIIGPKGEKTFGKGSVQTISYLKHTMDFKENGEPKLSGLRLTTALYYTPSGRTIHKIGITPDHEVAVTREQEIALLRHGLIGDPDTSNLNLDPPPTEGAPVEGAPAPEAAPVEGAPAPAEPAPAEAAPTEAAPESSATPAEFHDVMLEEAVKYMREKLLVQPAPQA